MKKIVPINVAEGIFLPCFDQLLNKTEEYSAIDCSVHQQWDGMHIVSSSKVFSLLWKDSVELGDYDEILFFINVPPHVNIEARATIDGRDECLLAKTSGADAPSEYKGCVAGKLLTGIEMVFSTEDNTFDQNHVHLYWIGVVNSEKEPEIEKSLPKYTEESWKGYINYGAKISADRNILFSVDELEKIKSSMKNPKYKDTFDTIYSNAEEFFKREDPEAYIREFIPTTRHLWRYTRVRDRNVNGALSSEAMLSLAISGYIFNKPEWSYRAARILMSITKIPHWFEGPQACMEGSTWHHVCFLEESIVSAFSIALGFLDGMFTDKALDEIKAAMKKHYKTIVKCCREEGYRRFMNQGMVGACGWMLGACGFAMLDGVTDSDEIEECYADHTSIVEGYITDQGYCVEGPGYYQYSIGQSISLWKAYAKFKNVGIREVIPQRALDSIKYIEATMSTAYDTGYSMPFSNSQFQPFSELILNLFTAIADWEKGKYYLKNRLSEKSRKDVGIIPFFLLLCYMTESIDVPEDIRGKKYYIFEQSGLGVFEHPNGKVWFCADDNPRTGHYHLDRGSINIEAYNKSVLADPGVTDYSNSLAGYMKKEDFHNLAHPDGIPMVPQSKIGNISANEAGIGCRTKVTAQDFIHPSPKIEYIRETDDGIEFSVDVEELYDERVLSGVRKGSYSSSGSFKLEDTWKFTEERALFVNFMAYGEWSIDGSKATMVADGIRLILEFRSQNPVVLITDDSMKDAHLRQMYRLRLKTEPNTEHWVSCSGKIEKI